MNLNLPSHPHLRCYLTLGPRRLITDHRWFQLVRGGPGTACRHYRGHLLKLPVGVLHLSALQEHMILLIFNTPPKVAYLRLHAFSGS